MNTRVRDDCQASSVALVPCKTKREGKDRDKKEGREGKARE